MTTSNILNSVHSRSFKITRNLSPFPIIGVILILPFAASSFCSPWKYENNVLFKIHDGLAYLECQVPGFGSAQVFETVENKSISLSCPFVLKSCPALARCNFDSFCLALFSSTISLHIFCNLFRTI